MRMTIFAGVVLIFALAGAACSGGTSPSAPSVPSVPSVPPGPPIAVLAVSTFTATLVPPATRSANFRYDLKLRLSETSGKSGATLKTLVLSVRGQSGSGCWPPQGVRINPGETWDMDSLGYCAPEVDSPAEASIVSVLVTFIDDDGRSGVVEGSADVTR